MGGFSHSPANLEDDNKAEVALITVKHWAKFHCITQIEQSIYIYKVQAAIYRKTRILPSTIFYFWRFLNITFAFSGTRRIESAIVLRGACFLASNLISYVTRMCASKALTSLAAKKRPGLIEEYK